jgi:tetratricopeptide (TPR) repeat protein
MHYVLGLALESNGQREQALERFRVSTSMSPGFAPGYLGASGIFMAEGKLDSVITFCSKALEIPSQYAAYAYNQRGTAYFSLGDLKSAAQDFRSAIRTDKSYVLAYINLAKIQVREGRRKDAIEGLRTVLTMDPNNVEARNLLGNLTR